MDELLGKKALVLLDAAGKPLNESAPNPLTATFCRIAHIHGSARVGEYDSSGVRGDDVREAVVRAQVPYIVTLLVYHSEFQVEPTPREYFLYAPMEMQKAAELAMRLWQRWENPRKKNSEFNFGDLRKQFPKVEDGVIAEPIDDNAFSEHWKDVKSRLHKQAGHPDDPFAFTCLDQDVRIFKTSDVQAGLDTKIK